MESNMILELNEVEKSYGACKALSINQMSFEKGIYGILGPNGAGKSTLIKILTENLNRDAGSILYCGTDILEMKEKYRGILGYMPQVSVGYPRMKVLDFMEYMALLKGMKLNKNTREKIIAILQRVNMSDSMGKRFRELSGGMKRRVLFAQALLGNPRILILDEPTAGLDPKERITMRNLIAQEAENRIVLLATHIVSDIECIADNIMLMKKGKILDCRSPEKWIEEIEKHVMEVFCTREESKKIEKEYIVSNIRQGKASMILRVVGDEFPSGYHMQYCEPTLDEVYLYFCLGDRIS